MFLFSYFCIFLYFGIFYKIIFSKVPYFHENWTLDVSWTASYEITLVCLSVRPSVRPPLNLLKIESLVFSDIVRDDSWLWYLVNGKARFFGKNWQSKFVPSRPKTDPKWGLSQFYWVWIIIFPLLCIQW